MPIVGINDLGGVFIGDFQSLPLDIGRRETYLKLFGSPMRRAKTLCRGDGFILDLDDGSYDISISARSDENQHRFRELIAFDGFVRVPSGNIVVCDVLHIMNRDTSDSGAPVFKEGGISLGVSPGIYAIKVSCSIYPAKEDDAGAVSITDEATERKCFKAKGDYMFGRITEDEFDDAEREYAAARLWFIRKIDCFLHPVEAIPKDFDPWDPVFEFKPERETILAFRNAE